MTKTKRKKTTRRNQTDATLRNVRAAQKAFGKVRYRIAQLQEVQKLLIEILAGKRLLTPAQVKMLEDALR